jgi:hypothetical protein
MQLCYFLHFTIVILAKQWRDCFARMRKHTGAFGCPDPDKDQPDAHETGTEAGEENYRNPQALMASG